MDLKKLQEEVNGRWGSQTDNPCHGSTPAHALTHMMKALGMLASALNDAEHERREMRPEEIEKYLADMVISAARFGSDVVNLNAACASRLGRKFPEPAKVTTSIDSELLEDLLRFFRENEHHPDCTCSDDALHTDSRSIRALLTERETASAVAS
jgi:hypothetical protein